MRTRPGSAPALPDLDGMTWHPMVVDWWAAVWSSPMAGEFLAVDRHGLVLLARLLHDFWTDPSRQLAGEIRLQVARFGLTPLDRRRLEWSIEAAQEAQDRGRRRAVTGVRQPKPAADPRLALHAPTDGPSHTG